MRTLGNKQSETAVSSESNRRIFDFLSKHQAGVLAAVDDHCEPHATVIYFSVHADFDITFTTKIGTKKHDVLDKNNHVMLVVFDQSAQATVQVIGRAEEITDETEFNRAFLSTAMTSLKTSQGGVPPIAKIHAGSYVAYRIIPDEIRMAMYIRPPSGNAGIFETIEFKR